jgi:hypothetical protein
MQVEVAMHKWSRNIPISIDTVLHLLGARDMQT